jgi:hypothetical protein
LKSKIATTKPKVSKVILKWDKELEKLNYNRTKNFTKKQTK